MMTKVIKVVGDDDAEEGFRPLWPGVRCALKKKKRRQGKGISTTVAGWSHIASHRYLHSQEVGVFERDMVRYLFIYR